jgi:hypothetical protein
VTATMRGITKFSFFIVIFSFHFIANVSRSIHIRQVVP